MAIAAVAGYRVWIGRFTLNLDAPIVARPSPGPSSPPTRRLLLIVLDGARADVALALPSLHGLALKGARAELWVDLPSISAAQYVSILSGVVPEDSGRRTNAGIAAAGLDSVASRVRAGGGSTAVTSDCVDWWPRLFPGDFDHSASLVGLSEALRWISERHAFTLIHLCAFDDAGHAAGADSEAYRLAGAEIDRSVTALLEAWGDAGPVLVTADHGHTNHGGHGGDEPEVRRSFVIAAGPRIRAGGADTGRLIDLAPTASVLLGVTAPASAEGRTLAGLLELDAAERRSLEAEDLRRSDRLRTATETRRATLRAHAAGERSRRFVVGLALLGAVVLWLWRDRRAPRVGLAWGVLTLALSALGYAVVLGRVSLSAHRSFGDLMLGAASLGAGATLVCVVAPSFALARRRSVDQAVGFVVVATVGATPLAAAILLWFGLTAQRVDVGGGLALALPSLANAALFGTASVAMLGQLALSVLERRGRSPSGA